MIVDFNKSPFDSIIYSASIVLKYFKDKGNFIYLYDIFEYCSNNNIKHIEFFLTIDWLYLIGIVEKINSKDELVLSETMVNALNNCTVSNKSVDYDKLYRNILEKLDKDYIGDDIINLKLINIYNLFREEVIKS